MTLYTPEDLLLYLYKETSPSQTTAIETALMEDWTLREKLEVLQTSLGILDNMVESPRDEVVTRIMNYARETMPEPVH